MIKKKTTVKRTCTKKKVGGWGNKKGKGIRWGFKLPGRFYSTKTNRRYSSEKEARDAIRESHEYKRLPRGFEIWREE